MLKVAKFPSAPDMVALMITRRCNLHCVHCSAAPEQFLREDMSTKEILSTIDDLAGCQVFKIVVTGGEPLLHPDFFMIAEAILRHPMRMQVNTNATLITAEMVQRLQRLPRRPNISVSLDGVTAETYDHIRGRASFAHMQKGIRMLTAAGLDVRPFVVVSRLNYQELPRIAEFAQSIGARSIKVANPTLCGRVPQHEAEMALTRDQLEELLEMVLAIDRRHPGLLNGAWLTMARIFSGLRRSQLVRLKKEDGTLLNCGAAWTQAAIASDGTVAPCEMAFTCRAGNVRDQSFGYIWHNSPVFDAIRACRGTPLQQVLGCETCCWYRVCQGPCPASGYTMTGVWPSADPKCTVREIGRLFGEEPAPCGAVEGRPDENGNAL